MNLNNVLSVTDFQRNPKGLLGRLRASKSPAVLTVNGKPEFVVQDAQSYQDLLDKVSAAEDIEAVRIGLSQSVAGQGRDASAFFADFEKQHGLQSNNSTKGRIRRI